MESEQENLCADAGYAGDGPRKAMIASGYAPHVRPRGQATGSYTHLPLPTIYPL